MKILFVLECANQATNGTTATCVRFAKELEKRGHIVTMIGYEEIIGEKYHRYYGLPKYKMPFADNAIVKDGFVLCKMVYETIYEAMKGQDLVHLFLPFKLSHVCRLIAEDQKIAVTTAFHIVPQNCTSAIHLGWSKVINGTILYFFKKYLYNNVRYVHCPSPMAADIMKKHHFKSTPRVISNGVIPFFQKIDDVKKPEEFKDKFVVCMSGRLADEKRQDLIIRAVAKSKYNDKIQIILCGQGPNYERYEDAVVTLTVMSANGQMLYTAQVEAEAGNNSYELNVGDLAAGIYYYAMEYKGQRLVRKMNVVK